MVDKPVGSMLSLPNPLVLMQSYDNVTYFMPRYQLASDLWYKYLPGESLVNNDENNVEKYMYNNYPQVAKKQPFYYYATNFQGQKVPFIGNIEPSIFGPPVLTNKDIFWNDKIITDTKHLEVIKPTDTSTRFNQFGFVLPRTFAGWKRIVSAADTYNGLNFSTNDEVFDPDLCFKGDTFDGRPPIDIYY